MTTSLDRGSDQSVPAAQPPSVRNLGKSHALGLTSATGLVIGSIVGTGVFTMPAVLAGAGTMSILVLAVIAVGAMLLAILFGQLTKRVPNSDGGVYAYSRHEFGDFAGYLVGWCYWIQTWAGNAAIVASWVFYVDALLDLRNPAGMTNWAIALVGLWIPAVINLAGVRQMAWFQNVTVVLKFLPLVFVGVVGWFFVKSANFGPFNASGGSLYSGIGIAAGVALFSFIGVEAAAITAKRVLNPRINVARASIIGTAASAILYVLVTAAVMGLVPHGALAKTGSPFVDAFETIFPNAAWAGRFIAAIAVISGIGALNGWTLIVTETSRAMAQDDLFPKAFGWTAGRPHTRVRRVTTSTPTRATVATAASTPTSTWSTTPPPNRFLAGNHVVTHRSGDPVPVVVQPGLRTRTSPDTVTDRT
jgi:APA family basic amino acid/polyamine antiporter